MVFNIINYLQNYTVVLFVTCNQLIVKLFIFTTIIKMNKVQIMYTFHAVLNTIAIILLIIGLYFSIKKPQGWFKKHRNSMIGFGICMILSILYALIIREFVQKNQSGKHNIHAIIGIILGCLILIQLCLGIVFRKTLNNYLIIHRIIAIFIVLLLVGQIILGIKAFKKLPST
jgi:hypothetical protein